MNAPVSIQQQIPRFASVEKLVEQMGQDVEETRRLLS